MPKSCAISCLNDLRPVALTAVPMKICERLFLQHLKPLVLPFLDPLQFAYQANRNCEDAVLLILEKLLSHLEYTYKGFSARVMFFDFSSAFNTIQPHILIGKLLEMNVPYSFINWVMNYLTNRSQFVKLSSSCHSDLLFSNTGVPQGTVLAPFLFTLYTYDARSTDELCPLIKFADDTALIGLIKNNDDRAYLNQLNSFVEYCDLNFLSLNTSKTKEMLIDFRSHTNDSQPVVIKGSAVARVSSYKYLGIVLNDKLTWGDHVDTIIKKLNSRLYCLRKMSNFQVRPEILMMFYNAVICSVWRYCLICWGGNVSKTEMNRIDCVIRKAGKVLGEMQPDVYSVYLDILNAKLEKIYDDFGHPLHNITFNNRMKSGRLRLPFIKTSRHRNSFIPRAISAFNDKFQR